MPYIHTNLLHLRTLALTLYYSHRHTHAYRYAGATHTSLYTAILKAGLLGWLVLPSPVDEDLAQ